MNSRTLLLIVVLALLSIPSMYTQSHASAQHGGDLSYEHVPTVSQPYRFKVRFVYYRFCEGLAAPGSFGLNTTPVTPCAGASALPVVSLQQIPTGVFPPNIFFPVGIGNTTTPSPWPFLCPFGVGCDTGAFDPYSRAEAYVYEGFVNIPSTMRCAQWVFSIDFCCLPVSPGNINISSPSSNLGRYEAMVNTEFFSPAEIQAGARQHSSRFSTPPTTRIPVGQRYTMSPGLEERDGDSVQVVFDNLKTAGGTVVPYVGMGVTNTPPINPFPNNFIAAGQGPVLLDRTTGTMSLVPGSLFGAYLAIRADEFRLVNGNWVRVGYIGRSMVLRTTTGTGRISPEVNPSPQLSTPNGGFWGPNGTTTAPLSFNEYRVNAPVCKTTCFTITTRDFQDPGGVFQEVVIFSSTGLLQDSLSYQETTTTVGSFQSKTFCITPQAARLRNAPYLLHLFARDSWPISGLTSVTVPIYVVPGRDIETDKELVRCNNSPVQFQVSNAPIGSVFSWSPAALLVNPTSSFPSLNTNAQACTTRIDAFIPEVPPLTASVLSVQQPTCLQTQGTVRVQITGGTAPYQINGVSVTNALQLPSGTYTLTVTDAQGCTFSIPGTVVIQPIPTLSVTASARPVSCNGFNDGQIRLSVASGKPPYFITVNSQPAQFDTIVRNLAPGTYSIVVSDSNGCFLTIPSVSITQPPAISFNVLPILPAGPCTSANGAITVTSPSGGVPPYQYSLNGTSYQSSLLFSGLSPGRYVVYSRDSVGCVSTIISTLVNTSGVQVNQVSASSTVTCVGSSNGFINLSNLVPASGAFQFTLNSGTPVTSSSFSGLAAGHYRVLVTDTVTSCSFETHVRIAAPRPIQAMVVRRTDPTCFGASNGVYVVSAGGGTGLLNFAINNGAFALSPAFTNRPSGNDSLRVRDASGCQVAIGSSLTSPPFFSVSIASQVNPTCFGRSNGTISLNTTGGTPPYRFNRIGSPLQDSPVFANLTSGSYVFFATDARGCTAGSPSTTLSQPGVLTPQIQAVLASTCSTANGSISIQSVSGGIPPYSYSLNGTSYQSGGVFTSLTSGRYTVFIRDTAGCQQTQSVSVIHSGGISATPVVQSPSCIGLSNGSVQLTGVQGGTIRGVSYRYAPINSAFQTSSSFTGLTGGNKSFWIREIFPDTIRFTADVIAPDGCRQQADVNLVQSSGPLNITINQGATVAPLCPGDSLFLEATGALEYSWSPTTGLSDPFSARPRATPTTTTVYTVTGTSGSCTSTAQITVVVPSPSTLTTPGDTATCLGTGIALPSNGAQSYAWSGGSITSGALTCCPIVNPTQDTYYRLDATTTDGCLIQDSVLVRVYPTRAPEIILKDDLGSMSACTGDTIHLGLGIQGGSTGDCSSPFNLFNACSQPVAVKSVGVPTGIENTPFAFNPATQGISQQFILTASELIAAGIQPGILSGIKLFADQLSTSADSIRNLLVRIRCLPAQTTSFSLSPAVNAIPGGQTAKFFAMYSDGFQAAAYKVQSENTFMFDKGVYWDGTSNILVQTCFFNINGPVQTFPHRLRMVSTPGRFSLASTSSANNTAACTSCTLDAETRKQERPYVELILCGGKPARYQWEWFSISNTAGVTPALATTFAGFNQGSFEKAFVSAPVAGAYTYGLRLSDVAGCASDTLITVVEFSTNSVPPVIPPVIACQGAFTSLSIPGKTATLWYNDSARTQPIGAGSSIFVGPVNAPRTVYALTDTFLTHTGSVNYTPQSSGVPFVLQAIQTMTERFTVLRIMRLDTVYVQIEQPGSERVVQVKIQNGAILRSFPVEATAVGMLAIPLHVILAPGKYELVILPGQSSGFEVKGLLPTSGPGYTIPNKLMVGDQPVIFFDWKLAFGAGCRFVRQVTVLPGSVPPQASFSFTTSGRTIFFQNSSQSASSFIWTFGDASSSNTQANPVYTYPQFGTYTVRLIAQGSCGAADTVSQVIQMFPVGFADEQIALGDFQIYPNPGQELVHIYVPKEATYEWLDISGKHLHAGKLNEGTQSLDVSHMVQGSYLIRVQMGDSVRIKLWIKY